MVTPQITSFVCEKCGWADFYPAETCPRCNSNLKQTTISAVGRIVTFTAIRYPPKGFENQAPYVVAIIDIEGGPRVIGRISNASDEVKIGADVLLKSKTEGRLEFQLSP
jgi:uncharacterized OB-fold protein